MKPSSHLWAFLGTFLQYLQEARWGSSWWDVRIWSLYLKIECSTWKPNIQNQCNYFQAVYNLNTAFLYNVITGKYAFPLNSQTIMTLAVTSSRWRELTRLFLLQAAGDPTLYRRCSVIEREACRFQKKNLQHRTPLCFEKTQRKDIKY